MLQNIRVSVVTLQQYNRMFSASTNIFVMPVQMDFIGVEENGLSSNKVCYNILKLFVGLGDTVYIFYRFDSSFKY